MTISEPLHQVETSGPASGATVRLSARDVRETTWRALVAAGASAGEAQIAAEAVVFGEIHLGVGVDSARRELERTAAGYGPVRLTGDDVRVVSDSAGRGLLLLAPLAIGMVAARPASTPVLLPGFAWDPILIGFFVRHCGDGAPSFFAFEHREAKLLHGCRVDSDRSFTVYDDGQLDAISTLNPRMLSTLAAQPDGLVIVTDFGGFRAVDSLATVTAAVQRERQDHVFSHGVRIGRQLWTTLVDASRRYLAAEV